MSEIKLSPELQKMIGKIDREKKLVDDLGNIQGFIITPYMHSLLGRFIGPEPSREEIDGVTVDTEGYTTKEALALLRFRFPTLEGLEGE